VKVSQSGEAIVLYACEVGVESDSGEKATRTVFRRYSDFRMLAQQLRTELGPDKPLPPVPAKQRFQRVITGQDDLVDQRKRALESWLWDLLSDVHVAHSKALTTFLELGDARRGLIQASTQHEVEPSTPAHTDLPADTDVFASDTVPSSSFFPSSATVSTVVQPAVLSGVRRPAPPLPRSSSSLRSLARALCACEAGSGRRADVHEE
jgi:hypothetical protein